MRNFIMIVALAALSTSTIFAQAPERRTIKKKTVPSVETTKEQIRITPPPVVAPVTKQTEDAKPVNANFDSGITFQEEVHDYGTIQQGDNGTTDFVFFNKGKEAFIISSAKGSCGCTVPVPPKEPIEAGKSSSIKVTYDTKRIGAINKNVTVVVQSISDPSKTQTKILRIAGNIKPNPQTPEIEKPMEGPVNK